MPQGTRTAKQTGNSLISVPSLMKQFLEKWHRSNCTINVTLA